MHHHAVALHAGQSFDVLGRALESFIFLQPPHQLSAGVFFQPFLDWRSRQQQPRLDLGQDRGHQQVFGGQFQPHHVMHQLDIGHVLPGDLGNRDVQDVQVLPADQVQQQVQRAFE